MPVKKEKSLYEWTVMLYMFPLDKVFLKPYETLSLNLDNLGASKKVKILGLLYGNLYFDAGWRRKSASRFEVGARGFRFIDSTAKNTDISSSTSLSNFMNWCRKKAPAKNYLLVLWDHGGCFYLFESGEIRRSSLSSELKMETVSKNALIKRLYKSPPGRKKKYGYWFLVENSKNLKTASKFKRIIHWTRRFEVPDENYLDKPKLTITNKRVGNYQFAIIAPEKLSRKHLNYIIKEPAEALELSLLNKNSTGTLTVMEIKRAISESFPGKKLNNVLFVACCMQTLETAYELRDKCNYITASEDLMDFKMLENINSFGRLYQQPMLKPKDMAIRLVNDFPSYISGLVKSLGTLSSVNTSKVKTLAIMIDGLAEYLIKNKSTLENDVRTARNKCRYFSWLTKFYNIDFIWFLKNLDFITADQALKKRITKIISHVLGDSNLKNKHANKLVVNSFAGNARTGNLNKKSYGAQGFTIFFPKNIKEFYNSGLFDYYTLEKNETLSFVKDHKWVKFLRSYQCIP